MEDRISGWKLCLFLFPAMGLILFFFSAIVFIICSQSVGLFNYLGESRLSLEHWQEVINNKTTWIFFWYSFRQGMFSAIGSLVVAYPFALWLRTPFKGKSILEGILRIPMLIPGLVAAFLFINIISYHGFLNEVAVRLGIFSEPRRMQNDPYGIGVIVLQIWKNMPFALLLLSGSIKGISVEVIDSARDMGANKGTLLWRIILPLTVPTMRAALMLIFIGALGDFSFNVVAGPRSLQSLSQYIVTLTSQLYNVQQAAVITILLMGAALLGIIVLIMITEIWDPKRHLVKKILTCYSALRKKRHA